MSSDMKKLFHSGKVLQKIRELQGLSLDELSDELNIKPNDLIKWEDKGIPDEFINKCSLYFEVASTIFKAEVVNINTEYELKRLVERHLFPDSKIDVEPHEELPQTDKQLPFQVTFEKLTLCNIGI